MTQSQPLFKVVIPARYAATRLPGKPLLDIGGKPMVIRVVEQARASGASAVWVATDDKNIFSTVEQYGFHVALTASSHLSGTDRIAELVEAQGWADDEIIINVQGDEPLMPPQLISQTAAYLSQHADIAMATAAHPLSDKADWLNPNIVKVVLDHANRALYFSRAPIPYLRDNSAALTAYRHVGIYAFRAGYLKKFAALPKSPIEALEALEQLRALWYGHAIGVLVSAHCSVGVDTQEDLQVVRSYFS